MNEQEYINKLESKLMYALSPTTHELSLETQKNFINIIRENIDEDTYTIKQELKKYWENEIDYKPKKQNNWDISEFIDSKIQKRIEEGGSIFPID